MVVVGHALLHSNESCAMHVGYGQLLRYWCYEAQLSSHEKQALRGALHTLVQRQYKEEQHALERRAHAVSFLGEKMKMPSK